MLRIAFFCTVLLFAAEDTLGIPENHNSPGTILSLWCLA